QIGPDRETINVIYVTDSNWHFLDALMIKKFILADPKIVVRDIMDNAFVTLSPSDKQEEAVKLMEHYNLTSIPVVDSENILVGIVTFDDVMDVAEEEATVDFHKTAGISPFEQSYLDIGVFPLFSRRVVWLFCLVFVNTISGMIISHFEQTISLCVSLVFFMPLLSSSAGNTGLQASTLVIRSMATENTNFKNSILIILKDLCVAIMIGLVMGVAVLLLGLLRGNIYVGISATVAMILVVIISSFLGTILPMILRLLKFDPAVASAPLITSCCDIINVAIYFSVAKWVLESFSR
ncbi:MAG: magnesium transporter, partial [Spirochaetales bacterium]|nr:magnesium transporter [Spirochaetales bacterium]